MIKTYALKVALPQQNRATLLDFCLQAGGHASLSVVLQRFLKTYLSPASSITAHLVPLFSDIIGLTRSKHMSPASEPLASTIKEILTAWTTHVLGPRPSNSAVVDLNSNLARFQCSCPHCTEVRTFLRSGERSINLNLIYATKAKHVQKELSISMRGLVNSSIIPTTPQGLRVCS
jgi:glutaredoxin